MTSSFEVDYDLNPTTLYTSITNSNWDAASRACRLYPEEARTWVVRRERDEDGNLLLMDANDDADDGSEHNSDNVLWRFLPLHSALARSPPAHFIKSLLKAYPQGLRERDASSMLPLHYACGNRASKDVIQLLLDESSGGGGYGYAAGVWEEDSNGMTALHYLGSWGQCQDGIVEMILRAAEDTKRGGGGARDVIQMEDGSGMTPLQLAREGGFDEIVDIMERCLMNGIGGEGGDEEEEENGPKANGLGLTVVTVPSPRNHSLPRSPSYRSKSSSTRSKSNVKSSFRNGGSSSSPRISISLDETSYQMEQRQDSSMRRDTLRSPRSGSVGGGSGRYSVHVMDSRSPVNPRQTMIPSQRTEASLDSSSHHHKERYSISTRSLESPRHMNSDNPTTTPRSSFTNMKTPRSSGRGAVGRFGFDSHGVTPSQSSPRFHSQPSQMAMQSMRAPMELTSPQHCTTNVHDLMGQIQQLQLQNESLHQHTSQMEVTLHQSQTENAELRAKLSAYENDAVHNSISNQQQRLVHEEKLEQTMMKLQSLFNRVGDTQSTLSQIVNVAERRENARLSSASKRHHLMMQLLQEEEREKEAESREHLYEGEMLGSAFEKEIRELEELKGEVGSLLDGLSLER